MRVQLPVLILFAIKRCAVPAHRVGEGALEEVVITTGQLFQRQCQIAALGVGQIGDPQNVGFGQK